MFSEALGCVFLVEDNPHDVAIFEYAARRMKFPITLQKHGCAQSATAEINRFDLLSDAQLPTLFVLDIELPDMNGDVIFRQIVDVYERRKVAQPAIVFMTHCETENARQCLPLSRFSTLREKPVSLDGYTAIFEEMLVLAKHRKTVH